MDIQYRNKFEEALQAFKKQLEEDSIAWKTKMSKDVRVRELYLNKEIKFKCEMKEFISNGYIMVKSFDDGKERHICNIECKTGDIYKPFPRGIKPPTNKRGNIFEKETFQNMDYFGGWLNRSE